MSTPKGKSRCITDGKECIACRRGAENHPTNKDGLPIHAHWVGDSLNVHEWVDA